MAKTLSADEVKKLFSSGQAKVVSPAPLGSSLPGTGSFAPKFISQPSPFGGGTQTTTTPIVGPAKQKTSGGGVNTASNVLDFLFGGQKVGELAGATTAKFAPGSFLESIGGVNPEGGPKANTPKAQEVKRAPIPFPKAREVAGDVAQIGLELGTLGVGPLAAFGKVEKGASLAQKALAGAKVGAAFGVAGAQKQGEGLKDTIKSGLITGGVGAAIPVVGAGVKKILEGTQKKLVNFALRTGVGKSGLNVEDAFLERKLGGRSLDSIISKTQQETDLLNKGLNMDFANRTIEARNIGPRGIVDQALQNIQKVFGATDIDEETLLQRVSDLVPDHASLVNKKDLTPDEMWTLAKAVNRNLKRESVQLGNRTLSNEQKAVLEYVKTLTNTLKENTGTEGEFKALSEATRINQLARKAKNAFKALGRPGLIDVLSAAGGWVTGGPLGAAKLVALERMLRHPVFQGLAAQEINNLIKITPTIGPFAKTVLLRHIGNLEANGFFSKKETTVKPRSILPTTRPGQSGLPTR